MRLLPLLLVLIGIPVAAQEAPKKKGPRRRRPAAHSKATPEQIRKFNELEKKQKK